MLFLFKALIKTQYRPAPIHLVLWILLQVALSPWNRTNQIFRRPPTQSILLRQRYQGVMSNHMTFNMLLKGCLYEKNCPGSSPANRGPRFAGISSETQISPKIKLRLYEKKLSRQNEISALKSRDPGLPGQFIPI